MTPTGVRYVGQDHVSVIKQMSEAGSQDFDMHVTVSCALDATYVVAVTSARRIWGTEYSSRLQVLYSFFVVNDRLWLWKNQIGESVFDEVDGARSRHRCAIG